MADYCDRCFLLYEAELGQTPAEHRLTCENAEEDNEICRPVKGGSMIVEEVTPKPPGPSLSAPTSSTTASAMAKGSSRGGGRGGRGGVGVVSTGRGGRGGRGGVTITGRGAFAGDAAADDDDDSFTNDDSDEEDDEVETEHSFAELKKVEIVDLVSMVGKATDSAVSSGIGRAALLKLLLGSKKYTVSHLREMVEEEELELEGRSKKDEIIDLLVESVVAKKGSPSGSGASAVQGKMGSKATKTKKTKKTKKPAKTKTGRKKPQVKWKGVVKRADGIAKNVKSLDGDYSSFAYGANANPFFSRIANAPPTGKTPIKAPATRAALTPLTAMALAPSPQTPTGVFNKCHFK